MKKKLWVNKAMSYKEAKEFDYDYYFAMSPEERLETIQLLRELFLKIKPNYYLKGKKGTKYEKGRRGLCRFVKIVQ